MADNGKIKSQHPLIQKCLDIAYDEDIKVEGLPTGDILYVKIAKEKIFSIDKHNDQYVIYVDGNGIEIGDNYKEDARNLFVLLLSKNLKQYPQKIEAAVNYLNNKIIKR